MFMLKRTLAVVPAAVALSLAPAIPALAGTPSSGGSVNVSATVNAVESLSLTGLSSTITFPAATAGSTTTDSSAENYAISMTGGTGYSLTLTPGADLSDADGDTIPNTDLSITPTVSSNAPGWNHVNNGSKTITLGSSPVTLDTETTGADGSISVTYTEAWQLAIPATAPSGTYSETMTYLALADS
jgi:hypothetical protein